MSREARAGEQIPILRAVATCIARDIAVRIWDESPWRPRPGSECLRLVVEVSRDEFFRSLRALVDRGAVHTERLFGRAPGPGIAEEIRRDHAVEFAQTLALCAEAGHAVTIHQAPAGRPTSVAPEDHLLTFTVTVGAEAYYAMRPHQF